MTSNLISGLYYLFGSFAFHAQRVIAAEDACGCGQGFTCDAETGECTRVGIKLMEPVGRVSEVTVCPGLETFFKYFNLLYPYLIGSGAGIAVLMAVVGGLQIIMSGGDQTGRQAGIDRFKNALLGLLMALFAGLILQTLNPTFFVPGEVAGEVDPGSPCAQ